MESIKIEVIGNIARVAQKPKRITSGTVGLPVEFTFDSQWDGLSKTAVFEAGGVQRVAENLDFNAVVPWEVLAKPDRWLSIGVYGANADGSVIIPTIWANVSPIQVGTDPEGDPSLGPKLPVWQKILNSIGNLLGLTTNDKSNLVGAINEVHNIALAGGIETDTTLTKKGKAAEAKTTGDAIRSHVGNSNNPHNVSPEQIGAVSAKYVEIPKNGDVDYLITPGRYACETAEVAKTLLGCPVEGPFTLDVRYANGKGPHVGQELKPAGKGARLYRQFVGCEEVLSEEAKVLYNRVHGLKPQENGFNGVHDYSWYAENLSTKTAILESASQLYGLADIVNGTNGATQDTLEGWTIKLGNDIVVNKGDASEWDGNASGVYTWTRIGVNPTDSGSTRNFRGTFDGQGHYISGLHGGENNNNGLFGFTYGATIKNLAVINSYFATNASNGQFLGSVVARLLSGGTLKNVYSDAILESRQGDWFTGGVAGCVKYSKADSCVFAGTIFSHEGTGKNNKYIGGITGGPDSGGHSAELTNCLFIGAIKSNDSGVGGIAGMLGPGSVVDGCVSAGTIEGNARQVGAVLGWVSGTGNHAITNCYYSAELGRNLYAGGDAGSVAETTGSKVLPAECVEHSMIPGKWAKVYDSENKPTIEEIGAAPDGYGLGALGSTYAADLNACIRNGWYYTDNYSTNVPYGSYFKYATVFVTARTSKIIVQRLIAPEAVSFHAEMLRYTQDGGATWVDEWVNPPMTVGVEYRTTERWNGKAVYAKLIVATVTMNATTGVKDVGIPHGVTNFGTIVRCTAQNGRYVLPYLYENDASESVAYVDQTNIHLRLVKCEMTNAEFGFTIYYTKAEVAI